MIQSSNYIKSSSRASFAASMTSMPVPKPTMGLQVAAVHLNLLKVLYLRKHIGNCGGVQGPVLSIPTGTRQLTILWSVQGAGNHTKFTINRCRSLLEGLLIIGELEGSHCHRVGYFSFQLRSFLALWYAMSTSDHCKPFLRGRMKSYQNTMSVGLNIRNYQVCGVFHSSNRFFFHGGRVTIPGRLVTGGNHWQPGQQIKTTVFGSTSNMALEKPPISRCVYHNLPCRQCPFLGEFITSSLQPPIWQVDASDDVAMCSPGLARAPMDVMSSIRVASVASCAVGIRWKVVQHKKRSGTAL